MEKRIFLAVLISIGVLWTWAAVAPRLFPDMMPKPVPAVEAGNTATTSGAATPATTSTGSAPATATAVAKQPATVQAAAIVPVAASVEQVTTVDTPEYAARFSNRGAQLISFSLKRYREQNGRPVELVKGRDVNRMDFPFALATPDATLNHTLNGSFYELSDRVEKGERVLEYRFATNSVSVTKTFRLNGEYLFKFAVSVTPPVKYRVEMGPGLRTLNPAEHDSQFMITGSGVVQRDNSLKVITREKADRLLTYDDAQFIGIEDNYFLSMLRPSHAGGTILRKVDVITGPKEEKRHELFAGVNAANDGVVSGEAFFGPKETGLLDRFGLEKTLQFGMFGVIGRFFLTALVWINHATKNYGFAIIVLTILIKIVLFPLQYKSITSMKKMQRVQPQIEQIKARYKKARTDADQRQKMNTEVMSLYQKEGINPMGGCLPILLQLPILWGFYGLLSRAIELRGAPFIWWIHDLSVRDPYYITPILMTATMFIQQQMTPTTVDPAQKRIFMMMPLIFGFIFKDFPSGLVLYWLVQNVLTIVQQMIMNRQDPK